MRLLRKLRENIAQVHPLFWLSGGCLNFIMAVVPEAIILFKLYFLAAAAFIFVSVAISIEERRNNSND